MEISSNTLPRRVMEVVPLIEKRLTDACKRHMSAVHCFIPDGRIAALDTINADIVIYATCRIIERLLNSGHIAFDGIRTDPAHVHYIVSSVEYGMVREYGHMLFLNKHVPELLHRVLCAFILKEHVLVRMVSRETLMRPRKKNTVLAAHPSLQ